MNPETLKTLAHYRQWANEALYECVAALPDDERTKHRQTPFGSMLRTLGHIYAVDALFRAHLEQREHGFTSRNVDESISFDALRQMQRDIDDWYVKWTHKLDAARAEQIVRFKFLDGKPGAMTHAEILLHVVNHSTFHRGFIVDMLAQIPVKPPATDFTVFVRDETSRLE